MPAILIAGTDLTAVELREHAAGERNTRVARRMLAITKAVDGYSPAGCTVALPTG